MSVFLTGQAGGRADALSKPQAAFDNLWTGWYVEFYGGVPYWEAILRASGNLMVTASKQYLCDVFLVGGGGGGYNNEKTGSATVKTGGGSGYTAMGTGIVLTGTLPVVVGAGGFNGTSGGATTFGSVTAAGGVSVTGCGGSGGAWYAPAQGSTTYGIGAGNGASVRDDATYGRGDGKEMKRFYAPEKVNDPGAPGDPPIAEGMCGGGGGILPGTILFGELTTQSGLFSQKYIGQGYGGGGCAMKNAGKSTGGNHGCAILRVRM